MEVRVNVVVELIILNMTTLLPSRVVGRMILRIFNFSVNGVIGVNPIVVFVRFTKRRLGQTVVKEKLLNLSPINLILPFNVQEQLKKD